jgi:hypothetical protein
MCELILVFIIYIRVRSNGAMVEKKRINTSAKGARNERKSMDFYEAQGYYTIKSSASKGIWDFIAYSKSDWIVCQVKSNRGPGALEMAVMREEMVPLGTKKVLHIWIDRKKLPIVEEL